MPVPLVAGAAAGLSTAGAILQDIPVLSGLLDQHPADAGRAKDNAGWYQLALAGNQDAANALWNAAGYSRDANHGVAPDVLRPSVEFSGGGWATRSQQEDAWAKYTQLVIGGVVDPATGKIILNQQHGAVAPGALALASTLPGVAGVPGWAILVVVVILFIVLARGAHG